MFQKNNFSLSVIVVIVLISLFSCNERKVFLQGNWVWISDNNKYFEVLIDSNKIIGYRHSFLYPREYKIIKDSIYLDKVNDNQYDKGYKIDILKDGNISLYDKDNDSILLFKLKNISFTLDSIKTDKDLDRYELEYTTRKKKYKNTVSQSRW